MVTFLSQTIRSISGIGDTRKGVLVSASISVVGSCILSAGVGVINPLIYVVGGILYIMVAVPLADRKKTRVWSRRNTTDSWVS